MITRDDELRQALTALKVESKVEIVLKTKRAEDVGEVDNFAQEVAQRKVWRVENERGLRRDVEDQSKGESSPGEENGEQQRRANGEGSGHDGDHMWVLRPMAKRAA